LNSSGQLVSGVGDGIKEITVTITEENSSNDNGRLVYFNGMSRNFATLVSQVTNGIVYADLPANNGQLAGEFLLNDGTKTMNQAQPVTAPLPTNQSQTLQGSSQPASGLK